MHSTRLLAVALFLATQTAGAQQQSTPRAFTPADWYKVVSVGSPAMSPDGRQVAFTVTRVQEADNRRHSEVWVVPTAGGEPVRYTSPSFSSSNPRWSPDGRILYFMSQRPGGRGNTWSLRMDEPRGEAYQPAEAAPTGSVTRDNRLVAWSEPIRPDTADSAGTRGGRSDADPFGRMDSTARPPHGAVTQPLDPRRFDGRHIVEIGYKANGRGFVANPREPRVIRPSQIWTQALDGGTKRQVTDAAYSHGGVEVSPDGRWIAFTADASLRADSVTQAERDSLSKLPFSIDRDSATRNDADIYIMPVGGGTPRRLTSAPGSEGNVAWSPDGRFITYISRPTRAQNARLWIVDVRGGEPRNLLGDWQYEASGYQWISNGEIVANAAIGGRTALFSISPRTGERREVLGGRRRLSGFSYDAAGSKVAYISTSVNTPTELYIADVTGRNERRLTTLNDSLNKAIAWADAERFTYNSVDGLEIEAWMMRPHGYEPGRRYPLVLYIHGGPHSAYGENWFDEFQNIAGAGMWVLYTNPRGSSGYGADFTFSTRGRWGLEDYEDLMKAVDIAAARADVDSTRMGVTGGSYGGFMTAWITTKTHRFKAAQADRMISNWMSWYGSSDAQGLTEWEFYGKPWENWAVYDSLSPIRYVDRVRTPTLIVQSEEDHRTPMTDAEQWFMGLRKNDVPVEFIRYPRSNHDLSRTGEPWLLVDRLGRLRQWFAHHLQDTPRTADR
ncbi:MAG TPA: S9 family peptidase [Gemmatimonadaceae bacterium]|nr:S9 family peptidase [Gemmatimonadaceae bacterium]